MFCYNFYNMNICLIRLQLYICMLHAAICVSKLTITGSDNGLSPSRCQAIICTNDGILLIGDLGTYFSEILIEIQTFSFWKKKWKVSSAKWRPFCRGLNELIMPIWEKPWNSCWKTLKCNIYSNTLINMMWHIYFKKALSICYVCIPQYVTVMFYVTILKLLYSGVSWRPDYDICGVLWHKQVSRIWTGNYIPQILWMYIMVQTITGTT